jgi:hypothetical protein
MNAAIKAILPPTLRENRPASSRVRQSPVWTPIDTPRCDYAALIYVPKEIEQVEDTHCMPRTWQEMKKRVDLAEDAGREPQPAPTEPWPYPKP